MTDSTAREASTDQLVVGASAGGIEALAYFIAGSTANRELTETVDRLLEQVDMLRMAVATA